MEKSIKRVIFREVLDHMSSPEITMIVGARQVGKTTLMHDLAQKVAESGQKTLFLNLDIESDAEFFASQEFLLSRIRLEFGSERGYVFIDEIQRKSDAGVFLKGLYDAKTPYKFVVSGSGSLELKEKIHESLAGRKRLFEMRPVTFTEMVNFRTEDRYRDRLEEFFRIRTDVTEGMLREYLGFGGYPRVILVESREEKEKVMQEIFRSYAERDIAYLLKTDRTDAFVKLLRLLAVQSGNILSYATLSRDANMSFQTLKKYLWYAEKTFAIHIAIPYFRNNYKEIVKAPVVYFNDLGMRGALLGSFGDMRQESLGFAFQNFVFNVLSERFRWKHATIKFWRTTNGKEVDFVVDNGGSIIPVEAKYSHVTSDKIEKSMKDFLERYEPEEAWVVNLSLDMERKFGKTTVKFLPFWKIM